MTLRGRSRLGETEFVLDSVHGVIGGHFGGTIDVSVPFETATQIVATLSCIRAWFEWKHSAGAHHWVHKCHLHWQQAGRVHAEPGPAGTRLRFNIPVPAGLSASEPPPILAR